MISQQQIDELVLWDGLKEFGAFILSYGDEGKMPNLKDIDLMKIAKFVPHIWIYDFRAEDIDKKLLFKFCGTKIEEMHQETMQGKFDFNAAFVKNIGSKQKGSRIYYHYLEVADNGVTAYANRSEFFIDRLGMKTHRSIETLLFPCSSNGVDVDYGIGCAKWALGDKSENTFIKF